jgi:hypothetical protein
MMEKRRTLLSLDQDAADLLDSVTTERKKGAFVSELIRQYAQAQPNESPGILERIEQRLVRIQILLEEQEQPES